MAERRLGLDPRRQIRESLPLLGIWLAGCLLLAAAGLQNAAPVKELFLDPAALTDSPWYTGLISNLGILSWAVAVTSGFGGAWVAKQTGRPSASRFLLVGSAATLVLLADDLLQLHAVWIPQVGPPKAAAQLLVVVPVVLWLMTSYQDLFRTRWLLVFSALVCFTVSLVIDYGFALRGTVSLMVEDGAKFLGVLAWAQYFVLTAKDIAASTISAAANPPISARVTEVAKPRQSAISEERQLA